VAVTVTVTVVALTLGGRRRLEWARRYTVHFLPLWPRSDLPCDVVLVKVKDGGGRDGCERLCGRGQGVGGAADERRAEVEEVELAIRAELVVDGEVRKV